MSRSSLLILLERLHADLGFRQRFELSPEEVLAEIPELSAEDREMLLAYRANWLEEHHIQACPRCGNLAVVSVNGRVIRCDTCAEPAGCSCSSC